ncbi:hypothetical protein [Curtobacterium sp. MCJR17_020]|nr:hypothetical protein [Curtobacterium sp. MCJR17_020]WIE70805.1 hypothetical protein DEJ14_011360 [Curtobacterium sp. MCJR17_020]
MTDDNTEPDPAEMVWSTNPEPLSPAEFRYRLMLERGWADRVTPWRMR